MRHLADVISLEEARTERQPSEVTPPEPSPEAPVVRQLSAGRRLIIATDGGEETIQVQGEDGAVEVTIELTASGPVVRLSSARLELDATREIAMRCERLDIEAEDGARIHTRGIASLSGRETRVGAKGDVRLKGARIFLN